jgi:hypothetical protein
MRIRIVSSILCLALVLAAAPVQAQYGVSGPSTRATGENYKFEFGAYFWNPTPDLAIRSEWRGIVGDRIDLVEDLGIEKTRFSQIRAVLRPATKHKLRFEFTPISYEQEEGILSRDVIFNGQRYSLSLPVETTLKWNAYRFTYEYDLIYRDRGFFGILIEAKYTDVEATLRNVIVEEFVRARAPIPALGAIGRVYVAPNISITGEFSGFKLPESIDEDYKGKFFDFDIYGTINFSDHFGAQLGYRSFEVNYKVETDEGDLQIRGPYLGGVVRF